MARTRTLEKEKLKNYIDFFIEMAGRRVISLSELRILVGRMQRASMTMPQGSKAFMGSVLAMLRGLKMPWHRRRVTKKAQKDILALVSILQSNHGQGYFDTSHLPWHDDVWTDAMKQDKQAAWGWCCGNGQYDYGIFDRKESPESRKFVERSSRTMTTRPVSHSAKNLNKSFHSREHLAST